MASIFKRKGGHSYHIEFNDTRGQHRRVLGFKDRSATKELAAKIERAVAIRQGGGVLGGEMLQWLEGLRPDIRDNLAKWDVIDPQRAAAGREIVSHVAEWAEVLTAKGNNSRYVHNAKSHVERMAQGCGWRSLSDITTAAAQRWLAEKRTKGMAASTSNGFVRSVKGFLNWMVAERRLAENPLSHLKTTNPKLDPHHQRRALTLEEIRKLLAAAEAGDKHHGLTGGERALVYRLAIEAGLRYSEIHSLTKGLFDFSADPATVTIRPEDEKARRGATLVLRAELAADLKAHLALSLPRAKAFPGMWKLAGAAMLDADLKVAGIGKRDEDGRVLDFHALRHTFGTLLAASNVHPRVAQDLLRHSTITLTMGVYTHTTLDSRMGALDKLPDIKAAEPENEVEGGENTAYGSVYGSKWVAFNGISWQNVAKIFRE